jgi:hypothetical protein
MSISRLLLYRYLKVFIPFTIRYRYQLNGTLRYRRAQTVEVMVAGNVEASFFRQLSALIGC